MHLIAIQPERWVCHLVIIKIMIKIEYRPRFRGFFFLPMMSIMMEGYSSAAAVMYRPK